MVREKSILGAFQDRVCWHGALDELQVDNACVYEGNFFMKYVGDILICLWQSVSYHQQQIYADNICKSLKFETKYLSYSTGAVTNLCLGALVLNFLIWNHTIDLNIADGEYSPYILATGCLDDISLLLCFGFNKEQTFSLDFKEICAWWFSISVHMSWKVITAQTRKILYRSEIRSDLDPTMHNLLINPFSYTNFNCVPYQFRQT